MEEWRPVVGYEAWGGTSSNETACASWGRRHYSDAFSGSKVNIDAPSHAIWTGTVKIFLYSVRN